MNIFLTGLVILQSINALSVPTGASDTTETYENNSSTVDTTKFEQTTNNNTVSIQQAKQQPVGRDYDSSSSSDSGQFSGGNHRWYRSWLCWRSYFLLLLLVFSRKMLQLIPTNSIVFLFKV